MTMLEGLMRRSGPRSRNRHVRFKAGKSAIDASLLNSFTGLAL